MADIDYQHRFWNELKAIKSEIEYLRLYLIEAERIDNSIKLTLAVASSGGIAGWALWRNQNLQIVWATLIAVSQVVNAINRFLPWEKRIKAIHGAKSELAGIFLFAEREWFSVSEGLLTIQEIHEITLDIKERRNSVLERYLGEVLLPDRNRFVKKAGSIADQYFVHYYGSKLSK